MYKDNKTPTNVNAQRLAFSPWLIAGLALLPCPTLSYTYPELWGAPGKKNRIHCGTPPPPRASLPPSLCLFLSLLASYTAPCPQVHGPHSPSPSPAAFPFSPSPAPGPLILPGYNPRPQICHFSQKHRPSQSTDAQSCKGLTGLLVQHPALL